jgi:hypothetical protein
LHYLHNNVLVIDQSECIEDRPVPGPFPDFPMTKREKPWERGWIQLVTNNKNARQALVCGGLNPTAITILHIILVQRLRDKWNTPN